MRAVQITRFGGPDVLTVVDVQAPTPQAGQVLVAVEATSINSYDTLVRQGRLAIVSGRKFPIGIGLDFVGTVSALGAGVSSFRVGDLVWGIIHPRQKHTVASAADFVVVAADRIAPAPTSISVTEAASLVVAGSTARIALNEIELGPGQRLLVRGAAGGVGTAVVQLAHALGAHVTAIAGAASAKVLTELGADAVVDRASAAPKTVGSFDAIVDLVGRDLLAWRRALNSSGRMVTVALTGAAILAVGLSSVHGARRIRSFNANPATSMLEALTIDVDTRALRPVVASERPLTDIVAAHRAFEGGGFVGKHVITVTH